MEDDCGNACSIAGVNVDGRSSLVIADYFESSLVVWQTACCTTKRRQRRRRRRLLPRMSPPLLTSSRFLWCFFVGAPSGEARAPKCRWRCCTVAVALNAANAILHALLLWLSNFFGVIFLLLVLLLLKLLVFDQRLEVNLCCSKWATRSANNNNNKYVWMCVTCGFA